MKKINFSTQLLLTTLFLITPNIVIGQEFIKEPQVKQLISIVREVASQKWLTCAYDGDYSHFTMVSETSSTAPTLELPIKYYVSDFEIYNDTAYFCGYVDSSRTIAIFGYFSLTSFPSTTVFCSRISWLTKLKKLSVFNHNNKPHIVFTGNESLFQSVLVDAIITSTNHWDIFETHQYEIGNNVYDDVAVTDDYIVATSRIIDLDSGLIHYFHKPTSYTSIFPYHYFFRSVGYPTITPIIVTACHDNYFATVCKDSDSSFVMSRYNAFNDNISLRSGLQLNGECRDINFNNNSKNVEVLNKVFWTKRGSGLALHYDFTLTNSAIIPAHYFDNQNLFSIDYLSCQTDCFIASGASNEYGILRLYRYKYDVWNSCTFEKPIYGEKIPNNYRGYEYTYCSLYNMIEAKPITYKIINSTVYTICDN